MPTTPAFSAGLTSSPPAGVPGKKGLQVQMVDDAILLGVKQAAFNVNLSQLLDLTDRTNRIPFSCAGRTFYFNRANIESLDLRITALSSRGVIITLILLSYRGNDPELNRIMLHPRYDPACPNGLSAFNTVTDEGVRHFNACIEFLAQRYGHPDPSGGRVSHFIVGNEVNSHWYWCNMGKVSMEDFAEDYLRTMRLCHDAVRRHSQTIRIYLSLEHHWSMRYPAGSELQTFAGRAFLERFAARARESGDFDWHVAFHPYPENLFEPRTWNDKSATASDDSPRITFRNIEILPRYLRQERFLFQGKPRRIILSEQGFHSRGDPESEKLQAAAYCYAYYKTAHLEGIDAFIYHRHVDHAAEGGLNLGLWRRKKDSVSEPESRKPIYDVFRSADTAEWEAAFKFALPAIGIQSWDQLER